MITKVQDVGYSVYGETLGELWLDMVETVLKNGNLSWTKIEVGLR